MDTPSAKVRLDVPFLSQHRDIKDRQWRVKGCGATCLKMVLEFLKNGREVPSIDELIQEGIAIRAYSEDGWVHTRLALIAHNYGFGAYNEEFKSMDVDYERQRFAEGPHKDRMMEYGIKKITWVLSRKRPVIVSVSKRFKDKDKFHQVVLTGVDTKNGTSGFYYNDPDYENDEGKDRFVDLATFKEHWRKFAIFVAK